MSFIRNNPTLRAYQIEGVHRVMANLAAGKHTVLVAPTGSGKTVMAAEIAKGFKNVLFVAHRRELIEQARAATDGGTVYAETIQSGRKLSPKTVDLLIIDEAHRAAAASYKKIIARYPNAARLGLTATPRRNDGESLADAFDDIVEVSTTRDLVSGSHLVPSVIFEAPDEALSLLSALRLRGGDYDSAELAEVMNQPRLVGNVVREYIKRASGRKAIVFAVSVRHSQAIVQAFLDAGVRAVHLDGRAKATKRASALKDLSDGETQVLCNVDLFTEGWDCPPVSCVIMARPTESLTLHLQCIGRGMRAFPGKRDLIILDHAGNVERHGAPDEFRAWSLETLRQQGEREARDMEELRVRALGYASLEEYELEQKRFRETTYSAADCSRLFQSVGIKHHHPALTAAGVEAAGGSGMATRYNKEDVERVLGLYRDAYTMLQCQQILGMGRASTRALLRQSGLNSLKATHSFGRYPKCQVDSLRDTLARTYTSGEVAALFGKAASNGLNYLKRLGLKPAFNYRVDREFRFWRADVDQVIASSQVYYKLSECKRILCPLLGFKGGDLPGFLLRNKIRPLARGVYPRAEVDALARIARESVKCQKFLELSGLTRSKFSYWLNKSGIKPILGGGKGTKTRYSVEDVDAFVGTYCGSNAAAARL